MRRVVRRGIVSFGAAAIVLMALASAASAATSWSDAPSEWWVASYGVTAEQVCGVADGFIDGTFRPNQAVTRGQFTKMAVSGLDVPLLSPAAPTFVDVPRSHIFFSHVEGAAASGIVGGVEASTGWYFKPADFITRQQASSILARYLSNAEVEASGVIHGVGERTYLTLEEWYLWEGAFYVNGFLDRAAIDKSHVAATAYLVFHGGVKGSEAGYLGPTMRLKRAQAAALVLRAAAAVDSLTTPPKAPTLTATVPAGRGEDKWATEPRPLVEGIATPFSQVYVYEADGTEWLAAGYADSTGHVSLRVETPLSQGVHHLVARQRSEAGLFSSVSNALVYSVDTEAPVVSIVSPCADGVFRTNDPAYPFLASAIDEGPSQTTASGVDTVDFLYADLDEVLPTSWDEFTALSVDTSAPYEALYPERGLRDAHYLFAVRALDVAGNESLLMLDHAYVAGVTQEILIGDDDGGQE